MTQTKHSPGNKKFEQFQFILRTHRHPPTSASVNVDFPCKCNMVSCGEMRFTNTKGLITHYTNFHSLEDRDCIFSSCNSSFKSSRALKNSKEDKSAQNVIRRHFRTKHIQADQLILKESFRLVPPVLVVPDPNDESQVNLEVEPDLPDQALDHEDIYEPEDVDNILFNEPEFNETYFLDDFSDYYNQLVNFKFIPQSTVQDIAESNLKNTKRMLEVQQIKLRECLNNLPQNITDEQTTEIDNSARGNRGKPFSESSKKA